MPNVFDSIDPVEYSWQIVGVFVVLAAVVVFAYMSWSSGSGCPKELHRSADGSLRLEPSGQVFPDMNAFQKWWHASRESLSCPIPVLTGMRSVGPRDETGDEQTYAKTPINKVDDYEFSRIFGYERDGRMEVPRQNFNLILNQRRFDWPDKPLSSDERRAKYKGLHEGFTADGELVTEAAQRYGEHRDDDVDCRVSREAREVADMVAKAYESDQDYEPVVTKVGAHHWEVNELKPRHRQQPYEKPDPADNRVVDTGNDATDIAFEYRERETVDKAIDPFFPPGFPDEGERRADPWYGPVPGMERPFGPTFDHKKWY